MSKAEKRYFVFGANGFVGNAIASSLEKRFLKTIRITRNEHDFLSSSIWNQIDEIKETDILVFAAAQVPVRNFHDFRNNISMIENFLLNFARKGPRYVINISSDAVYSDSFEPISELSPLGPQSLHGSMHLVRELALNESFGEHVLHVRPTLIFGPNDPHGGYGPNKFMRDAITKGSISLYGRGEEIRDHIFVDDVGEIVAMAGIKEVTGVLNATTGKELTFMQIAETIAKQVTDATIQFIPRNGALPHLGMRTFSNKRLRELMPEFKFISLEEGLNSMRSQITGH